MSNKLKILFGTMTGNAEECANTLSEKCQAAGIETEVQDLADYPAESLQNEERVAIVISTWGEGDPPDDAEEFCYGVYDQKAGDLPNLEFAVCALGDTSYDEFCGCGKKLEEALLKSGAKKIFDRTDLDVDFEDGFNEWADNFVVSISA
ncbi:MAG: flavodoxin domain-containing protein [Puniceicoccaceae bacterium]